MGKRHKKCSHPELLTCCQINTQKLNVNTNSICVSFQGTRDHRFGQEGRDLMWKVGFILVNQRSLIFAQREGRVYEGQWQEQGQGWAWPPWASLRTRAWLEQKDPILRIEEKDTLFISVDMQISKTTALSRSVCFTCLFIKIMNLCLEASPSIT